MVNTDYLEHSGPFGAKYLSFLETINQLRPSLHRYCARMTGSVMDGEDVVQEALFEAYRKLDQFDESRPLKPWLFRIAHNRCIDFLRKRGVRIEAETQAAVSETFEPAAPQALGVGRAVEQLVSALPPKERASILLKDVFDYSLEEIAHLVDSTVGGVKAALNRGRTKLASLSPRVQEPQRKADPELQRVLELYVERFNRRDWDGLRELISADAQLRVCDAFAGPMAEAPYFGNYARLSVPWRLTVGQVDGEPVIVSLRLSGDAWVPYSFVRLEVSAHRVERIVDYSHCPWVAQLAEHVVAKNVS
ncbi:sigma-70 family RNA polymerase sigma factor [Acidobacteria bacterium AB60]|nr:sigma-70 family RNA polymerase sigma factor [Acidobacteria bacterium AB60]